VSSPKAGGGLYWEKVPGKKRGGKEEGVSFLPEMSGGGVVRRKIWIPDREVSRESSECTKKGRGQTTS